MKSKTTGRQMTLPRSSEKPVMPEGYYSGDKPNPNLRAFVEQHLKDNPYDPVTDKYDVPAFNKPIEATKATAIYNMHTYWSKKPHDAIRQYIRHYTKPGDLVLDPFCGSGGTALAALMEDRKAIAIDRSPAATFITKNYCTPVDPDELQAAFEQVRAKVQDEINWLYETRCDRCGGNATIAYTVYSQVFQCPRCLEQVPLFDCIEVEGKTADGKPKKISLCPSCHKKGRDEEISTRGDRLDAVPVLVDYICDNGCKPARSQRRHNDSNKKRREYFEKYELAKLRQIDAKPIPYWCPPHRMMNIADDTTPWGDKWRAGSSNFRTVAELFTKRNLWALASVRDAIMGCAQSRDSLLFAFTSICLGMSKMYRWTADGQHDFVKGTYYIPQLFREINVLQSFLGKYGGRAGIDALPSALYPHVCISTQSSLSLLQVANDSIDYIFTDPPYAGNVQYGELNFVWEAWLDFDTKWQDEEVIVNETRGKTESDWAAMMKQAMAECYRVLKPGHWASLCYHDTSEGTWALLQDLMAEVGFVTESTGQALFIESSKKSYNQENADKVNKRDLVINFRKPRLGEFGSDRVVIPNGADAKTFRELARQIIRECLTNSPGSTKDRVYDELVSRMVRAGTMQAHNFEELLGEVADEAQTAGGASRWYLKEIEESTADAAETAKEDKAAEVLDKFIAKKGEDTGAEGVHYSDLFEQFLYGVKDKPRRSLAEWLPDYFYKTEDGTWRLPAGVDEQELKVKARATGVNRKIKRFANMLAAGVTIPQPKIPTSQTLAEWIRHAKRAGLFEAGKLLYERGGLNLDKLSEEQQVEVEEDYQTCVRALQRAAGGEAGVKKRGRRRAGAN